MPATANRTTYTDEHGRTVTVDANGELISITSTNTVRAIARCTTCKRTGNIHYDVTTTRYNHAPRTDHFLHHHDTGITGGANVPGALDRFLYRVATATATCTHTLKVSLVKGNEDPSKPCDGRCMGAVGPACSCSCGGKNHGTAHNSW